MLRTEFPQASSCSIFARSGRSRIGSRFLPGAVGAPPIGARLVLVMWIPKIRADERTESRNVRPPAFCRVTEARQNSVTVLLRQFHQSRRDGAAAANCRCMFDREARQLFG